MLARFDRLRRSGPLRPLLLVLALSGLLAIPVVAFASHSVVTLTGSTFEIDTDANFVLDDSGKDWASVSDDWQADTASGPNDESFGQGTKEDSAVPSVVDGSIPPNKSDLKFFGIYKEEGSPGFLNMYWSRVQDPAGTTNMDFEFNKRQCTRGLTPADPDCSSNGMTPLRSVGDLLIIYDLANGGTNAQLSMRRWTVGGVWGAPETLATDAVGSINTSSISAANADGRGAHSPRTFGEAQVNLSRLFGSGCESFGSVYLKSRSSDSFTSAVKDFVPPKAVNITNCGTVNITKTDDASPPNRVAGAVFTLYKDLGTVGGARDTSPTTLDVATTITCTTASVDDPNTAGNQIGTCSMSNVPFGDYWLVETTTPSGYQTAAEVSFSMTSGNATQGFTIVDPRDPGSIKIKKVKDTSPTTPLAGAVFTLYNDLGTVGGTRQATSIDTTTGITCTTSAGDDVNTPATEPPPGECTLENVMSAGNYWIVETTTPSGYETAADRAVTLTAGQDLDLTASPFVDKRQFKVIVLVCEEAGNSLYPSAVTIGGTAAGTSIADVPAGALTTKSVTEANLCGIEGAYRSGLTASATAKAATVTIAP